jgi:hypothetical protein
MTSDVFKLRGKKQDNTAMDPLIVLSTEDVRCVYHQNDTKLVANIGVLDILYIDYRRIYGFDYNHQKLLVWDANWNFQKEICFPMMKHWICKVAFGLDQKCKDSLYLIDVNDGVSRVDMDFYGYPIMSNVSYVCQLDICARTIQEVYMRDMFWYIVTTSKEQGTKVHVHLPTFVLVYTLDVSDHMIQNTLLEGSTRLLYSVGNEIHAYDLIERSSSVVYMMHRTDAISCFSLHHGTLIVATVNQEIYKVNLASEHNDLYALCEHPLRKLYFMQKDNKFNNTLFTFPHVRNIPLQNIDLLLGQEQLEFENAMKYGHVVSTDVPMKEIYPDEDFYSFDVKKSISEWMVQSKESNLHVKGPCYMIQQGKGIPWYFHHYHLNFSRIGQERHMYEMVAIGQQSVGHSYFIYVHPSTHAIHAVPDISGWIKCYTIRLDKHFWISKISLKGTKYAMDVRVKMTNEL